tara:strand:+ start:2157 stop:2759 length:603 start_codon:yes stop_codon:yes gene_type:complete
MLRQTINLHRSFKAPVTTATLFTWKRYWIMNGLVVVMMTAIYFSSLTHEYYKKSQLKNKQQTLAAYQADFKKLKEKFPQLFFSDDINESVKKFKQEMAAQQSIINMLSKRIPFSDDLLALSRTIVPNVWLTSIMIEKNGDDVIITGDSIGTANLHKFIANLEKDKIFKDFSAVIHEVNNKDVTNATNRIDFEIKMARDEY